MKQVAALTLAAALGLGLVSSAHALTPSEMFAADEAGALMESDHVDPSGAPLHPCHGLASGTAHHSCGTRTGGPAGGLF